MQLKKPVALIILDGFGFSPQKNGNAIAQATTPHLHSWLTHFPHTLLKASGVAVGLPQGYVGNSEVGHLTIGSGRILPQPLTIINNAIADGSFFINPILIENLHKLTQSGKSLHLIGLLSDAGVHSSMEHLYAFLQAAQDAKIKNVFIHAILDGRDAPQKSASFYLDQLETYLKKVKSNAIIATLHGRFYAMDRDHNWSRTQMSYATLTAQQTETIKNWHTLLEQNYAENITDEFIQPVQLNPAGIIKNGDGIIFFNIRPDRARQLTAALTNATFDKFPVHHFNLSFFITPVNYTYDNTSQTQALFAQEPITNTLKEVLCSNKKTIFSIAETEKYAHITYFFDGRKEKIFTNEVRILIPSIHAKNYIANPGMSAAIITESVIKSLKKNPKDFYLINYANADMVGHSGNLAATIKAVECLDKEVEKLYQMIVVKMDGTIFITGDHGKAEQMIDLQTGQPYTAHTTNSVPFIMLNNEFKEKEIPLPLTQLADIAPFILSYMHLPIPPEMVPTD